MRRFDLVVVLGLALVGCAPKEPPKFGAEVDPPYGWSECQAAGRKECQR